MSIETLPERARRLATENQEHVRRERKHLNALTTLLGLPPTASWEDVLGALRPLDPSLRAAMDRAGAPTAGPDGAPVSDGYRARWCAEEVVRQRGLLTGELRKLYNETMEEAKNFLLYGVPNRPPLSFPGLEDKPLIGPLPGDPGTKSAPQDRRLVALDKFYELDHPMWSCEGCGEDWPLDVVTACLFCTKPDGSEDDPDPGLPEQPQVVEPHPDPVVDVASPGLGVRED